VTDTVVIAAGQYAGGFAGAAFSSERMAVMTNVKVFAHSYVGGAFGGAGGSNYELSVLDSVVSTIYDDLYDDVKATTNGGVSIYPNTDRMNAIKASKNIYVGGIMGQLRAIVSTVVNTTVGAVGADYVGGVTGYNNGADAVSLNEVLDTKVFGRSYIGGVTGGFIKGSVDRNVTNAEVEGSGVYVGGIVGYMQPNKSLDAGNLARAYENIFAGRVQGGDYVGGIVGCVKGNLYDITTSVSYPYYNGTSTTKLTFATLMTADRDNHMIGKVHATGDGVSGEVTASLLYNLDTTLAIASPTAPMGGRIWEYSVLKVRNDAVYAKDLSGSAIGGGVSYKYASRDGDATSADLAPDEEELYSPSDLLLTREHYAMTYNATAETWLHHLNENTSADNVTDGTPSEIATASNSYVRQVWRTAATSFWYSGYIDGYLPYALTNLQIHYQNAAGNAQRAEVGTQALYSEGKDPITGTYNSVAHTPMLETAGNWEHTDTVYGDLMKPSVDRNDRRGILYMNASGNLDYHYKGGIKIPQNPVSQAAAFSLMSVEAPAPEPQVYTSAADKLNIEFESFSPGDYLRVFDAKGEVELTSYAAIDRDVYTLSYDFKTPLLL
jgi:hypothetical protein